MQLKSISLMNFRQFKDLKISFPSSKDGKNVTLIFGDNGTGKTTLANAIIWCLYGQIYFEKKELCNIHMKQKTPIDEVTDFVEGELKFEHRNFIYTVTRKILYKKIDKDTLRETQNKLDELKSFKLPKNLIEFLQGDKLHFELDDCDFKWIEFFSLIDTIPMKVGRQKLLRISKATGDYEDIYIVWNPKTKKIAFYDMEHKELKDITDFVDFIENISSYMQKIIEGDL